MKLDKKYFPINTGVACPLKWTWHTLRFYEGSSSSCHRVQPVPIDINNFSQFHNTEHWLKQRRQMLSGEFPQMGCQQYCGSIEAAGGTSDRLNHLKIPDISPIELESDPSAIVVTPKILEVFLNNTCNLACIYCDESNSSRIQTENKKFGHIPITITGYDFATEKSQNFDQLIDNFFLYLEENYLKLKRLHILGGEPFFLKEFDRVIEFIGQRKHPGLELNVVTNLTMDFNKLKSFIFSMKRLVSRRQISRLDITVSLDCLGKEQEYVRYGIDLKKVLKNFEFLVSEKWITLNVNSTITSLTIKTMPDLIDYLNKLRVNRKITHSFAHVDFKLWLHCKAFGAHYFDEDFRKILKLMPENLTQYQNEKEYMLGLWKSLSQFELDLKSLTQLSAYLDEIDRRRNTNWREVFPWLDKELTDINHVV